MSTRRAERMGALLQEAIGRLLLRGLKDPRVSGVIVTGVDMSGDLRHAHVYYRLLDLEAVPAVAQAGLERATGYIQGVVGRELRLRYTPELRFTFDAAPDRARRVEELLAGAVDQPDEESGGTEEPHARPTTRR
jgi:ribosome-binding factor A